MILPAAFLFAFQGPRAESLPADARSSAVQTAFATVLEGRVLASAGFPAREAVVTCSGGGKAVTDAHGWFRLEVEIPSGVTRVELSAFQGSGATLTTATATVEVSAAAGPALASLPVLMLSGGCQPSWVPTFGVLPGIDGPPASSPHGVNAIAVFDDGQGNGPELYLGGNFPRAGGVERPYLAKWDGLRYESVGGGTNDVVWELIVWDDGQGGGPALYAGGEFTSAGGVPAARIAKWDGTSWSALGSGVGGGTGFTAVNALEIFDDGLGGGEALFVAGRFTAPFANIARWDGSSWTGVGATLDSFVEDLLVFDDGGGPALYAAGNFRNPVNRVGRWNGSAWSSLANGVGTGANRAVALGVFDDGSGPALYVGGTFSSASGVSAGRIAKWNGAQWSALGSGVDSTVLPDSVVSSLAVHDDGSGPALYVGGNFNRAGGIATGLIARWNGTSWSALEGGLGGVSGGIVQSMVAFDHGLGGGPLLYLAGAFNVVDGGRAYGLGSWGGSEWGLPGSSVNDRVRAFTVFDDGSGPALYAGGQFESAGGERVASIGRWDGTSWSALGSGLSGAPPGESPMVLALATHDDGGGAALFAAGTFTMAGGAPALRIARWDGANWSPLAGGLASHGRALVVHDDGTGPALFAGGLFSGGNHNHVAKWDGTSWQPLANGTDDAVYALAVFDAGGGPQLYAAGAFASASGVPAAGIARWNGLSWSSADLGLSGPVLALEVFDDGSGPALYAGGDFRYAGSGAFANHVARWDGALWSDLGGGLQGGFPYDAVWALTVFDDGRGPALYAGGDFYQAGPLLTRSLARWDGTSWSALGRGVINDLRQAQILALESFDDGGGPALYVGGGFTLALDSLDAHLARWVSCDTTAPVLSCPSSVAIDDPLGGLLGEAVVFSVTATDDRDPAPAVVCTPPSGSVFPPGVTTVRCTATDSSGNQSTCEFPVFVNRRVRAR